MPPRPPRAAKGDDDMPERLSPSLGINVDNFASGLSSRPNNPGTPSTAVGSDESSTPSESEVEWAGSLDTSKTLRPESASQTAVEADVVVLPTPPFPPNNNNLAMVWTSGGGV
jgi:hypothetical protein